MKLIIINGPPAAGKTTIAAPLAAKLDMPLLAKDSVKEFLFDTLGTRDREWSKTLGKVSNEFLYHFTDTLLSKGESIIIENAFEVKFAKPALQLLIDTYNPEVIEIYCTAKPNVMRKRFIARNESGERHPGHVDTVNYVSILGVLLNKYAPLNIGKMIKIDTTHESVDIDSLVKRLK